MLTPHDYQLKLCRAAYHWLVNQNKRSLLIVSPTGSGKTVTGAFFVKKMEELKDWSCNVFAHRREIIHQTATKLSQAGLHPGIVMSGELMIHSRSLQVCSIQTFASWVERGKIDLRWPDLIWVDEAHRAMSKTYYHLILTAMEHGTKILGTTATPIRGDGCGLGQVFEVMEVGPSPMELIERHFLCPVKYFVGMVPSTDGIKVVKGEYSENELAQLMDQKILIGNVVDNWMRLSRDRPTMAFCAGVQHSIHMAEMFKEMGIKAVHIDGDTDPKIRDKVFNDSLTGKVEVICNAQVYIEGTDMPWISCVIDACPQKGVGPFLQKGGRGMRTWEGKQNLHYHDHSGNVAVHGRLEKDRPWMLTTGREMVEKLRLLRERDQVEHVCPECGFLFSGSVCLNCRAEYVRTGKELDYVEAELQDMTVAEYEAAMNAEYSPAQKQQWWQELKGYGEMCGKKQGWAMHCWESKFKEKFPKAFWSLPAADVCSEVVEKFAKNQLVSARIRNHYRQLKANTYAR